MPRMLIYACPHERGSGTAMITHPVRTAAVDSVLTALGVAPWALLKVRPMGGSDTIKTASMSRPGTTADDNWAATAVKVICRGDAIWTAPEQRVFAVALNSPRAALVVRTLGGGCVVGTAAECGIPAEGHVKVTACTTRSPRRGHAVRTTPEDHVTAVLHHVTAGQGGATSGSLAIRAAAVLTGGTQRLLRHIDAGTTPQVGSGRSRRAVRAAAVERTLAVYLVTSLAVGAESGRQTIKTTAKLGEIARRYLTATFIVITAKPSRTWSNKTHM